MTRSIRKLDKSISNKIAAGEVVERPASVIKELLENSIDAGSTQILIEIKDAGKELIRVSDNGHGINKDEILLAFERHATSKIYTDDEIYNIKSLGFRGEALASISSVSKVEIITKQKDAEHGIKAELLQGNIVHQASVGCQVGTTIMVKDLLYNTPARLKFLKSNATELNHINNIINNIALSHPDIGFKYIANDRNVFSTKGDGNLLNAIYTIYGREIAKNLLPIDVEYNQIKLSGFISKIKNTRGNRQLESTFVNNRYVKSRVFSMSIEDAYKSLIPKGRFPICFLYMNLPPRQIDVNIHPAKTEIKFRDEISIRNFITRSVNDVLLSNNIVPSIDFDGSRELSTIKDVENKEIHKNLDMVSNDVSLNKTSLNSSQNSHYTSTSETNSSSTKTPTLKPSTPLKKQLSDKVEDQISLALLKRKEDFLDIAKVSEDITKDDIKSIDAINESIKGFAIKEEKEKINLKSQYPSKPLSKENTINKEKSIHTLLDDLRIIGQLFSTYIICEANGLMYLIDQHAAHERIMYERFLESYKNTEIISQILLDPISIDLNYQDKKVVMDNKVIFRKLGYKIEDFGYNTIILREVPILFGSPVAKSFFMEIIDNIGVISSTYEYKTEKIISMSCKKAIKAMDKLDTIEMDKLLKELKTINNPFTCPHGRPTIISITKKEIEKKFFRS